MAAPQGDPYRPVRSGQQLRPQAYAWNRLLALARDSYGTAGGVPAGYDFGRDLTVALVQNDTGAPVPRFGVLGVEGGPLITPAHNLAEFQRRLAFAGGTPTALSAGKFAVLLGPLAKDAIGPAALAGVVPVQLTGPVAALAEVKVGDATQLQTTGWGTARVLWDDAAHAPGTRWAWARLGHATPPFSGALYQAFGVGHGAVGAATGFTPNFATGSQDFDTDGYLTSDGLSFQIPFNGYYAVGAYVSWTGSNYTSGDNVVLNLTISTGPGTVLVQDRRLQTEDYGTNMPGQHVHTIYGFNAGDLVELAISYSEHFNSIVNAPTSLAVAAFWIQRLG